MFFVFLLSILPAFMLRVRCQY